MFLIQLLDLSNNCIQSLNGMSAAKSLVELYLSHNQITDCETLVNCKTWSELKVLDLSYNPVTQSNTFRQNCLYYISGLKVLNLATPVYLHLVYDELENAVFLYLFQI